jgi:hypothetical protein
MKPYDVPCMPCWPTDFDLQRRDKRLIRDMKVGDSGYEVPWALEVDKNLRWTLNPHFDIEPSVGGTVSMGIKRTEAGFEITPPRNHMRDVQKWTVRGSIKGDIEIDTSMMPRLVQLKRCNCKECVLGFRQPGDAPLVVGGQAVVVPTGSVNTGDGRSPWPPPTNIDAEIEQLKAEIAMDAKKSEKNLADYLTDEDRDFFKFTDQLAGIGELVKKSEKAPPRKLYEERDSRTGITIVSTVDPALKRLYEQAKRERRARWMDTAAQWAGTIFGLLLSLSIAAGVIWFFVWVCTPAPVDPVQVAVQQAQAAQQAKICQAYAIAWNASPTTDPTKLAQLAQIQSAYNEYCR